jgi:hypothetical protein
MTIYCCSVESADTGRVLRSQDLSAIVRFIEHAAQRLTPEMISEVVFMIHVYKEEE